MLLLLLQAATPAPAAPPETLNFNLDPAFFAAADRDGDGQLTPDEFRTAILTRLAPTLAARGVSPDQQAATLRGPIEGSFASLDADRSGTLSPAELRPPPGATPQPPAPAAGTGSVQVDLRFDEAFLRAADTDGNGRLDRDEYVAAMMPRVDAAVRAGVTLRPEQRAAIRDRVVLPSFAHFDRNGDGGIDASELASGTPTAPATPPR